MKRKTSFDSAKIKQFFVAHGEKIGFAVFMVWFVYMVVGAFGVQPYDKTIDDLRGDVQAADSFIRQQKLSDEALRRENIRDRSNFKEEMLAASLDKIDPRVFAIGPLNPPLFERKSRRGEPEYLPLEELVGNYAHGAINFAPEAGQPANTPNVRGQRWIVITGLVPYEQQRKLYEDVFQNAILTRSATDVPNYAQFDLQRAEVTSSGEGELQWKSIDVPKAIESTLLRWSPQNRDQQRDPVPESLREPVLFEPLPPLVGGTHNPSVVAHPKIPLGQPEPEPAAAEEEVVAEPEEEQEVRGGGFGGVGTARPTTPRPAAATTAAAKPLSPYRMFRFLDFDIEPNKTYRYRVRLRLKNPNQGVQPQYLQDPKLASGEQRATAWSEPSPPISVPSDFHFLAGEVRPQIGANEPTASLKVRQWEAAAGDFVAAVFEKQHRGQLINYRDQQVSMRDPKGASRNTTIHVMTDEMLVDMTGGDGLAPNDRLKAPGELLLMDADGRLKIRSQLGDAVAFSSAGGDVAAPAGSRPTPQREPASRPTTRPSSNPFDVFGELPEGNQ